MPRKKSERGPRKIEASTTGRVYWRPGQPHPLDKLDEELEHLRAQLPGQLADLQQRAQQSEERLRTILDATRRDDPTSLLTLADHEAHQAIFQRFHNRKHYSHLHTQFTIQRYRRLLGRLQAIGAALDLANGLLEEEETLTPEYLAACKQTQIPTEHEQAVADFKWELQADRAMLTKEERRLQGIEEPLAAITGSTERSRQLLRDFEAQLPDLRSQLATGQGWFEVFYVPKRSYKAEVVLYAKALAQFRKRKTTIPEEIERAVHPQVRKLIQAGVTAFPTELRDEVYDIVEVGPYVKYRWREEKRTYSISLGLDDDYPPFPF